MFNTIFNTLSQNLLIVAAIVIGLFLVTILLRLGWLYRRVNRLLGIGTVFNHDKKTAISIETALVTAAADLAELKKFTTEMRH